MSYGNSQYALGQVIAPFLNPEDAQRVLEVLARRFWKYGLSLHPQKTRLVEFGRAARKCLNRRTRGITLPRGKYQHLLQRHLLALPHCSYLG
jgi:uracil-DNA glycosylase